MIRAELLARYGLVDGGGPLLTMVTRLAEQKGVDLLLPLTPFLRHLGATLIVLGDGEQGWPTRSTAAAAAVPATGGVHPWLRRSARPPAVRRRRCVR